MDNWKAERMRTIGFAFIMLVGSTSLGCQSWYHSSALPGMKTSRAQQEILDNLENDPFPSPTEVGMRGSETK